MFVYLVFLTIQVKTVGDYCSCRGARRSSFSSHSHVSLLFQYYAPIDPLLVDRESSCFDLWSLCMFWHVKLSLHNMEYKFPYISSVAEFDISSIIKDYFFFYIRRHPSLNILS